MTLASCSHLIHIWQFRFIFYSFCWEPLLQTWSLRISLKNGSSPVLRQSPIPQNNSQATGWVYPHTSCCPPHKHWEHWGGGRVSLSSILWKGHTPSRSTEAVFCCAASNLNVSIICPYKNTALSTFSTRDYICNQGNKIQVQQPYHRCFYENGESTERAKDRKGTKILHELCLSGMHVHPAKETFTSALQGNMAICQQEFSST